MNPFTCMCSVGEDHSVDAEIISAAKADDDTESTHSGPCASSLGVLSVGSSPISLFRQDNHSEVVVLNGRCSVPPSGAPSRWRVDAGGCLSSCVRTTSHRLDHDEERCINPISPAHELELDAAVCIGKRCSEDIRGFRLEAVSSGGKGLQCNRRRRSLSSLAEPGDIVCIRGGASALATVGEAGGLAGHLLLVIGQPKVIHAYSAEASDIVAWLPAAQDRFPLWKVRTLECTRSAPGLHEVYQLVHVEESSGKLILVGERTDSDELVEHSGGEVVELLKAPLELRNDFRADLLDEVIYEMYERSDDWSFGTAARAILLRAELNPEGWAERSTRADALRELQECWEVSPICTSIIISFWQRYLCKLALSGGCSSIVASPANVTLPRVCPEGASESGTSCEALRQCPPAEPLDLIARWMPLKSDRALPGELLEVLLRSGWTIVASVPRLPGPALREAF